MLIGNLKSGLLFLVLETGFFKLFFLIFPLDNCITTRRNSWQDWFIHFLGV